METNAPLDQAELAPVHGQSLSDDEVMLVLPADHLIGDVAAFHAAIRTAAQAAQNGHLATFGIVAATPETGYGYIQRGALLSQVGELPAFQVRRFTEKPDAATAQQFVDSGEYYWNAGIFAYNLQLVDGCRSINIAGCQHWLFAFFFQLSRQFAAGGCFPRTLKSDHQIRGKSTRGIG